VPQVPCLPRKTRLCHACHAKRRWMGYAMPAMQNEGGGGGGGGGGSGYRIKNKNPTQSCGEKNEKDYFCHVSQTLSVHTRGGTAAMLIRLCIRFVRHLDSLTWPLIYILGGCPLKGHVRRDGAAGDLVPLNVHVGGSAAENIYHAGTWGPS
jgi:hypothetical protein